MCATREILLWRHVSIAFCVLAAGNATLAQEDASDRQVLRLIDQLDSSRFVERQAAHRRLLALDAVAVPYLRRALRSESIEKAARARVILKIYLARDLKNQFQALARTPEASIDLEHGMWLISRLVNPMVERRVLDDELDALAKRVAGTFGDQVPASTDPQVAVERIVQVLFRDVGIGGNTTNYSHPDNSSLERVLASRKGLPILVSHVVVSVAQRIDVPIVGIGVPGRYMAKYDGARAPAGFARRDILIDPFGGRVIQADEIDRMVRGFNPEIHLQPSSKLATLVRMLNNLRSHFLHVGMVLQAQQTEEVRLLLASRLAD